MANTRVYSHVVTKEYLEANPELGAAGIKEGDKLKVTVSTKAAGLTPEDAAAELKAALLAAKANEGTGGPSSDDDKDGTNEDKEDDEDDDDDVFEVKTHPAIGLITEYFEGNAKGSADRAASIEASAKWLKGDIMSTIRHMGGGDVTKNIFTLFATELCEGIDELAEQLKVKE